MDFELERLQLRGFDTALDTTLSKEETLEMIVPDACPDILRVIETDGTVLLSRREAQNGTVELAGTFKLSVLYLPDGERCTRHLDVTIPFACSAEEKDITPTCAVVAVARLCHADAKALNPRKILARAEAVIDITVYAPRNDGICGAIPEGAAQGVEQLTEKQEVYLTARVQEKPFSCSDEISLSASRAAPVELLSSRAELNCGERKIIGNKLIFKGSANITLLYRGEDDGVYTALNELPFSQIMEVSGVGEEAESELALALISLTCVLDAGDPRLVNVNIEALAQAAVRETRIMEVLADAYSTKEYLTAQWETHTVDRCLDCGTRTQSFREAWETVVPMREAVDCRAAVGTVSHIREGAKLTLSAAVEVRVLYRDEDGELNFTTHPITVPCPLDLPDVAFCFCRCEVVGDVYATAAMGGIEVRLSLDFHYRAITRRQFTSLSDLCPGEPPERSGAQPSLTLRTLEGGERLWDVAKAYGTTIADIVKVNELEEESQAAGRLLLIPGRR